MIRWILLFLVAASFHPLQGQSDEAVRIWYDTRVVNGHSTEMNDHASMKFIIAHRFGSLSDGAYQAWGLDNATMRIGFDYGVLPWLNVGIGRSSFQKTADGFVKARFLRQGVRNSPIALVGFTGMAVNGLRFQDTTRTNYFTSRLSYTFQLIAARRFGDRVSFQLMPTMIHRNLIPDNSVKHDVFAVGTAGRYVVSKRLIISCEYFYVFPRQIDERFNNTLSIGVGLETKGHVFQFHVSNSRGMTEKFFVSETTGLWQEGNIHLGFNITRDFKFRGKHY